MTVATPPAPTPPPAAAELPREYLTLTARLEAAGAKLRLAQSLSGLALFVLALVPLAVGALLLAGAVDLPGWMNAGLWVVLAAGAAGGYGLFLHRPLFRQPTYGEIARVVEQEGEGLDNALINAVLLAQDYQAGDAVMGSHAWIPHVLKEASSHAEGIDLEGRVSWRGPRRSWVFAGMSVLVSAAVALLFHATLAHGFAVMLSPRQYVPRQGAVKIVSVMPGDDTALIGQPVLFSVTVDAPEHKTIPATLTVQYASGKTATYPMAAFGTDNSQYVRQGIIAAENMTYWIKAGDSESARFHITVLPEIKLTRYQLEIVPPAYMHRAAQAVSIEGREAVGPRTAVDVPAGSDVTVTALLDGPAREVLLDQATPTPGQDKGGPVSMNWVPEKKGFSVRLTVRDSTRFTLRVNDGANRTLAQFPASSGAGSQDYFSLNAVADLPPTVAVSEPGRDVDARPGDKVPLEVQAADDYGVTQLRLEIARNDDRDFRALQTWPVAPDKEGKPARTATMRYTLELPESSYKYSDTLRYRFVATDNRDLTRLDPQLGAQSAAGQIFTISFNDKAATAAASSKRWEELRAKLAAILDRQVALHKQAGGLASGITLDQMKKIDGAVSEGQKQIRTDLGAVARDFPFEPSMKLVQKSLQVLVVEDATSAVDRAGDLLLLSDVKNLPPLAVKLRQHQARIIDVLQTLLAIAAANEDRLAHAADHEGGDLPTDASDAWKKLADALKDFQKEQQGVIDATADLAKKPKDQYDANDKKELDSLAVQEDKWERFMNQRIADMSKIAEQDQSSAALLEEMVQMKVELATAKDALEAQATEIATPLEENGLEDAKALTTHIERWLQQQPDRTNWQMEEPVTQNDPVMAPLPEQLQDMVGDLMDKEEDLTQEMESMASKWVDSIDKGAGWDAADGPISNMSAQGVTGNQLPKNMEIQGRSGEGREGRSSGEMVGAVAEGKEGRQTPTRLTNDPFSAGQVDDKSKLPTGGATGGGKKGGLGSEGLEGPAPADDPNITQRLAGQQAAIRNESERLALQMHAAGYDNFKLVEANAYLKKSEDALKQNHYQNALYYQEQAVQSLNTAKVLASGQVHVVSDTSPTASEKSQKEIDSALNGPMPRGYGDPVKAYFEKMAGQ